MYVAVDVLWWMLCRREWWWEWMKEKRGRAVDKYLPLLGNYNLKEHGPSGSSTSLHHHHHHHHPQHLQFVLLDQRIWRGEERRAEVKVRREEAGRTRMRLRKGSNLAMMKTSLHVSNCVVDSFVCCISHLSIEWGEVGEDLTKKQNL